MTKPEQMLAGFVPPPRSQRKTYNLATMTELMAALGNPQEQIQVIHVAGTSGKTSTCYYIAELLRAEGLRVGLTVSPHVESLGERVQINGQPLSDSDFIKEFSDFEKLIPDVLRPTYFEVLVAFAYWYFRKQAVDVAVIETGIGGLLDGTNVVSNPSKYCVITDIGIDHTQVLGDTIEEIAAQKAGIIHQGNRVFMLEQDSIINEIFLKKAGAVGASIKILSEQLESASLPLFQNRNFSLARQTVEAFLGRKLSDESIKKGQAAYIPGRMEIIRLNGKTIVMDGAHNPQKLSQFERSFRAQFPESEPLLLAAMLKNSEHRIEENIKELSKINFQEVIATEFTSKQDIKKVSVTSKKLACEFRRFGFRATEVADSQNALEQAMSSSADFIVITGSLYLIFELRRTILEQA